MVQEIGLMMTVRAETCRHIYNWQSNYLCFGWTHS